MWSNSIFPKVAATLVGLMLGAAGAFAVSRPGTMIGRSGHIWLNQPTQIDGMTLKPGQYRIWHETTDSRNALVIHQVGDPDLALQNSDLEMVGTPVSVSCRVQALDVPARRTMVTTVPAGRGKRITRVEIKGERIALLLKASE